ncbi:MULTISPECIES: holo-ACP synthase [Anoxybacillus]|uniref:Holo-[acyl-carrier-protein] synthase n=1 Tax=Anoxybacillus flavithermus TaxID=33934 RepID=A0A178TJH0_9BACL|nr:holo-ACP synthase [Anoxybacillus flavithermus]ASA97355.1 holo-ACP synthase [Anoxybacillus flavithermus]ELK20548.1 4'-phosphopantetheinyl transferase [Anoxybacillus flavithermus TNO-09.006]MBE2906070.1 holo-ACP synthase [Anoxybacillus flavithermus]MBE2908908.1 holo-ACP synthase [Anoxybacillus flavithermus]MBE2911561.1 holo-ACP synthase [Anoxybacillus flavithermus]
MIVGIGIDIVELSRIAHLLERQPKFIERVLTENERMRFFELSSKRKIEFVAGRFAAKEAYAKALGTGIGTHVSFRDIEINNDENGKPYIISPSIDERVHVSISHSEHYAVAQVIIERLSS